MALDEARTNFGQYSWLKLVHLHAAAPLFALLAKFGAYAKR
jgi:hypothetical protein